ncbi:MAG: tRNA lysidine(34) synthetase TilS [Candidatus Nanopelagicales bacterium]|nr:tRNA lysidine(34) synthetase TilS [Actinomycetota bacterium]MBT5501682.1 tRNA lysidine(34) synthetase TilS [Actinomycetota bacterium]MDA9017530.1 tRNA lysidine(34) synthetase TilS [Actinomycetota bacterium]MDA9334354.1 tRNA lysidine(34) synthetase TilS [Actinomycetota bacterium]NCG03151.1 tRNA lysidine(34) synthetase TilS [Actinomycetales bacterium]
MSRSASHTVVSMRNSVEGCVEPDTDSVVVGLSGGPDSLVLTAVAVWVGIRSGFTVHAVVVDHGLQEGSYQIASNAVMAANILGVTSVEIRNVEVGSDGGMEMAARIARRAALLDAAGARPILLGHTANDQAETVMLRLLRGSGAHSLSAMSACSPPWHRPFLAHPRTDIEVAVSELLTPAGITPWQDPHNFDEAFSRVKMRTHLDVLSADFGPSIVTGLVRSADMLRADDQALEQLAVGHFRGAEISANETSMAIEELEVLPVAIRTRLIKLLFDQLVTGTRENSPLTHQHVMTVETLISRWSGQGEIALPLGVSAKREYGRLTLKRGN